MNRWMLGLFFFSVMWGNVWASPLELGASMREIEKVPVAKDAKLNVNGKTISLPLVGAGLRQKKVVFLKVDVYVAQLFASDPIKARLFQDASWLDAVPVVIKLNFLRNVEAKHVVSGFKDGLKANGVKQDDPNIIKFVSFLSEAAEIKKGDSFWIGGERLGDKEILYIENASGKFTSIEGTVGFIKSIFSIWLGKVEDSGLEALQKNLVQ